MNFWHIQMSQGLLDGIDKSDEEVLEILQEEGLIGTGEWKDKKSDQCKAFKEIMAKGDIVMVRAGQKPLALVKITSDSAPDYIYENWRRVKVLGYYSNSLGIYKGQTRGTLERVSNTNTDTAKFIINWYNNILANMETSKIADILKLKKQIILQGAPGTGKTYTTAELALSILGIEYDHANHKNVMEEYEKLFNKQIFFTTFHQSMDYEDFVEGLKPEITDEGGIVYKIEDGIFKNICNMSSGVDVIANIDDLYPLLLVNLDNDKKLTFKTKKQGNPFVIKKNGANNLSVWSGSNLETNNLPSSSITKEKLLENKGSNYSYYNPILEYIKELGEVNKEEYSKSIPRVLIIDEINRGNISKIFGELMTLLESDKRKDGDHPLQAILPYSKDPFEIPSNLYIIGTMNTTDRSVGHIDYAIRRRFAFYTLKSNVEAIKSYYQKIENSDEIRDKAIALFEAISKFLESKKLSDLDIDDLMVGHSYFMAQNMDELRIKLEYEIIPLIREYEKDGIITLSAEERKTLGNSWREILISSN